MHDRGRKNLQKYLIQASSADDVTANHAYSRVARTHRPVPARRPSERPIASGAVAGYRDSMVGSMNQYRGPDTKTHDTVARTSENKDDSVIGNRPRSSTSEPPKNGGSPIEKRHHYIEPPKRGFNRFS